jgi:3'-5' exoribonuclease
MSRRYVNQLAHQEQVDQIFQASNKQLRPNRNGVLYLQVDLSDRGGSISARLWNATEDQYRSFEEGDFVRVEGTAQMFQGAMQVIATQISRALASEVDSDDFQPLVTVDIERLSRRLREMLRGVNNPHLRTLCECFLLDEEFMRKLALAPAGVKNHHAYRGGLLEHVVNLMEVVLRVAPCYPMLDGEMLLMGAFLHDLGKIDELAYDRGFAYTDEGQLIGHLVMAVSMLETKVREAEQLSGEALPRELVLRLKHMIVSHHGEYEFGSPKLPMTLEAVALHLLDNIDAKLYSFQQQMKDDPNVESPWTNFNPTIGRKLYKGAVE